tara:strand:+ start:57 stop:869 length:813 start_codon:yes stop_codon:yes gene_type:complete
MEAFQVSGVPFRTDDFLVLSIIFSAIFGIAIHFIREVVFGRRGQRWDMRYQQVQRYDKIQIVVHWLFLVFLFALLITGMIIFKIDYFIAVYPAIGEMGLRILVAYHWYISIALLDLAIFHIIYDSIIIRKYNDFWITRVDIHNLLTIVRNFFVVSQKYPKIQKLHPMQKIFHLGLLITVFLLGFTGLTIWEPFLSFLRNIGLGSLEGWLYIQNSRYLHDLFTFILVALMIGHFYFSVLIPTNWKIFRGMTHGKLDLNSSKSNKKDKKKNE